MPRMTILHDILKGTDAPSDPKIRTSADPFWVPPSPEDFLKLAIKDRSMKTVFFAGLVGWFVVNVTAVLSLGQVREFVSLPNLKKERCSTR